MQLPIPNEQEVTEFINLYEQKFGVTLTREEAFEIGTRVLQIYFIQHYAIHPLCPEE